MKERLDKEMLRRIEVARQADIELPSALTGYRRSLKGTETGKGGAAITIKPLNVAAEELRAALQASADAYDHDCQWTIVLGTGVPDSPQLSLTPAQPQKPAKPAK